MLSDKWTEIEFALQMLNISDEEAKGIWIILAAICHLGCAGVSVGKYTSYSFIHIILLSPIIAAACPWHIMYQLSYVHVLHNTWQIMSHATFLF